MGALIKAIIVDDEERARYVLNSFLQEYKNDIEVVALCEDVEQAVQEIKKHQPDLVFLDIEMPNYTGFELVSFFDDVNFEIIFVTAYSQFALRAFEVAAFDYLLKPIEQTRLDQSIKQFIEKRNIDKDALNYQILKESLNEKSVKKMIVTHQGMQKALNIADIIAIEAKEAYATIFDIQGNAYTMSKNLKFYESLLEDSKVFFRVHKSWLINYHHIIQYSNSDYMIYLTNQLEAKISKYRKAEFDEWYRSFASNTSF
ncbi:MAG: response regulator transcription factor [Bacteroidetes bacterium]|nr:response regulator transcription factor [Bacteroidota bacterium]